MKRAAVRTLAVICQLLGPLIPKSMELVLLHWAREEICPLHKDVPYLLTRINELEAM